MKIPLLCQLGFHHPIGWTRTLAGQYWTCQTCFKRGV